MKEIDIGEIRQPLNPFEMQVLYLWKVLSIPEEGVTASNKQIAKVLGVTRKAVSHARWGIARKYRQI